MVCVKALVKHRQAEDEVSRLQDTLSKIVDEAGARTRQEVIYYTTSLLDILSFCLRVRLNTEQG